MRRKRWNYFVFCYSVFIFLKSLFLENEVKHISLHTTLKWVEKNYIDLYIKIFSKENIRVPFYWQSTLPTQPRKQFYWHSRRKQICCLMNCNYCLCLRIEISEGFYTNLTRKMSKILYVLRCNTWWQDKCLDVTVI
jgi:hypothetical protein